MAEQLKIYEVAKDEFRPATQDDIDLGRTRHEYRRP